MGRALAKPIIFSREKLMGFAEPAIGPATSGRTRWLYRSYALLARRRAFLGPCSIAVPLTNILAFATI
jgi:hypothetical protein